MTDVKVSLARLLSNSLRQIKNKPLADFIFHSMLCTVATVIWTTTPSAAQAGHLDPNFAAHGIFSFSSTSSGGGNNQANAIALQSDGKIVVAGQIGSRGGLLRLNTNGTLDSSFGSGGAVTSTIGGDIEQTFIALGLQADGKILVVATGCPPRGEVARFNANGSLDTTFGTGGVASSSLVARGLAVQPDAKIVVIGVEGGTALMTRLLSSGQTDTTFGASGMAPLAAGPGPIALQSDGKILIGAGGLVASAFANLPPGAGSVARYNVNGGLDRTFGISGQAASIVAPSAISVQGDGKILVAGTTITQLRVAGNASGFGAVRMNSNGSIDAAFGLRGGVGTSFPNASVTTASAAAFQANGDILVVGGAGNVSSSTGQLTESFALARYLGTGKLDSAFGKGGLVTTGFGSTAAFISSVVVQTDGNIVVGGSNGIGQIEVARYLGQ